jgi:hypothetical protein
MRRLAVACLVVSALAILAGVGTARAQTPVAWDEAELVWTPPTEYANGGGSLADCATGPCGIWYIVEASGSGGPGWGPVAITSETHYRVTDLRPGVWQFRIRAFFRGSGYSPPGPVVSKTIVEPVSGPPATTALQ